MRAHRVWGDTEAAARMRQLVLPITALWFGGQASLVGSAERSAGGPLEMAILPGADDRWYAVPEHAAILPCLEDGTPEAFVHTVKEPTVPQAAVLQHVNGVTTARGRRVLEVFCDSGD